MMRLYMCLLLLFTCVAPLYGMGAAPEALPMVTILDVIKNDIGSGALFLIPAVQSIVPVAAIALLKMLYHGGFSAAQLSEGVGFSLTGPILCIAIGCSLGNIISQLTETRWYNENDFVHSHNAFSARNRLRYSIALVYSFLTFKFLQDVLAEKSDDFFIKQPSLVVFQ